MATFKETIQINAPLEAVWAVLADTGNIADWNAGLISSHATNDIEGAGATRHCVINETQSLDEEVMHFDAPNAITFRIVQSTMPFHSADIRFTLNASSTGTTVNVSPLYVLKYGLFGQLLNLVYVRRVYRQGMRNLLRGLRGHVEASV